MPYFDNCEGHVSHQFYNTFSQDDYLPACHGCTESKAGIADVVKERLEQ